MNNSHVPQGTRIKSPVVEETTKKASDICKQQIGRMLD
jgi:hypothetical protein